uniref:Malonyl-CoA:ACP transacylase (MAT) domain-containing protein n=1 Tax=Timema bartmani TaxID=61472 RepID=A0A7R9F494_9NEOP|nr:unnamed protein product [Timema bartmani]
MYTRLLGGKVGNLLGKSARHRFYVLCVQVIPSPKQRSSRWISSSIPESAWNTALAQNSSAAYHVNNLLSPVLFKEALAHVPENAVVIELAPHCLLQAILKRSLGPTCTNVGLVKRLHPNNLEFLFSALGR